MNGHSTGWGPKSPLFEILATKALYILFKGKFYVCFDFEDWIKNKMEQGFQIMVILDLYGAHCLGNFIMSNKLGHSMDNGNKLKWIIGTHGNWKNQNSWGRFGATS